MVWRLEYPGNATAALLADDEVVATAGGSDRASAVINLWASLLTAHREDLAAIVARACREPATNTPSSGHDHATQEPPG